MSESHLENMLPLFEALASQTRLKIIDALANRPMNIAELAAEVKVSSAAVTPHVRKLEEAGLVSSHSSPGRHGAQKICSLAREELTISLRPVVSEMDCYTIGMPLGSYIDWAIKPTCGMATETGWIGQIDDPRYFADPARSGAQMLWMGSGFVDYRFPNYLKESQEPIALEFAAELSSEAPGFNNNWPSDINFYVNGIRVGMWTSPGDFGGRRGAYTPEWISDGINQYGLMKVIRVDPQGTFVDGTQVSDVTLNDINLANRADITLRLEAPETAAHAGGLTIFGRGFGNYGKDPELRLFYKARQR